MFLPADSPDSAEVGEMLDQLQKHFSENLRSPVWVIANKMDDPEREAKLGIDIQGGSTFENIVKVANKYNIPLSQVCLGCNAIFGRAQAGAVERRDALTVLKLGPEGDKPALVGAAGRVEIRPAFEELVKDGSVSLLRHLIKEEIGPSVAQGIFKQADVDLTRAKADLEATLEQALQMADKPAKKAARQWKDTLLLALADLSGNWPVEELPSAVPGRGALFAKLEEAGRKARERPQDIFLKDAKDGVLRAMDAPSLLTASPAMPRPFRRKWIKNSTMWSRRSTIRWPAGQAEQSPGRELARRPKSRRRCGRITSARIARRILARTAAAKPPGSGFYRPSSW